MAIVNPWEQWRDILDGVPIRRPTRDMSWILGENFSYHQDGNISFYPTSESEVVFSTLMQNKVADLANSIGQSTGSGTKYGTTEIEADLLRLAGRTVVGIDNNLESYDELVQWVQHRHAVTFVVIAVGGTVLSVTGSDEYASPILLNDRVLIGYLDDSYSHALRERSELSGVPGFLFEETWWTEDYLSFSENADQDTDEIELITPWMCFGLPVPGVGTAALYEARHTVQAIIGALVACTRSIGNSQWGAVPWLAGEATINSDPSQPLYEDDHVLSVGIQYRSRRSPHLEKAEYLDWFRATQDIDIAETYENPDWAALLDAVASESNTDSIAGLATYACRQLMLASQSADPDVRLRLSFSGISSVIQSDIELNLKQICQRYSARAPFLPGYDESERFDMQPDDIISAFDSAQRVIRTLDSGGGFGWERSVAQTARQSMDVLHGICISLIPRPAAKTFD